MLVIQSGQEYKYLMMMVGRFGENLLKYFLVRAIFSKYSFYSVL